MWLCLLTCGITRKCLSTYLSMCQCDRASAFILSHMYIDVCKTFWAACSAWRAVPVSTKDPMHMSSKIKTKCVYICGYTCRVVYLRMWTCSYRQSWIHGFSMIFTCICACGLATKVWLLSPCISVFSEWLLPVLWWHMQLLHLSSPFSDHGSCHPSSHHLLQLHLLAQVHETKLIKHKHWVEPVKPSPLGFFFPLLFLFTNLPMMRFSRRLLAALKWAGKSNI